MNMASTMATMQSQPSISAPLTKSVGSAWAKSQAGARVIATGIMISVERAMMPQRRRSAEIQSIREKYTRRAVSSNPGQRRPDIVRPDIDAGASNHERDHEAGVDSLRAGGAGFLGLADLRARGGTLEYAGLGFVI